MKRDENLPDMSDSNFEQSSYESDQRFIVPLFQTKLSSMSHATFDNSIKSELGDLYFTSLEEGDGLFTHNVGIVTKQFLLVNTITNVDFSNFIIFLMLLL